MRTLTARPEAPRTLNGKLKEFSWGLPLIVALIASMGGGALYSMAGGRFDPWAGKHALRAGLGIALMLMMGMIPLRVWMRTAYPLYVAMLALLVAVPLVGVSQMGARRWLGTGEFSLQPAEFMKIALVLALARYYMWLDQARVSKPLWLMPPLAMISAPFVLVLKQPDLGTAILILLIGLAVMFLAGVRPYFFAFGAAAAGLLGQAVWPYLKDYQQKRLITFLDPEADPLGAGYHIAQSKIAFGSGGFFGRGYLGGTQSQLNFLPEKHTDFIFTMLAEETGFVGAMALIVAYGVLLFMLLTMAWRAGTTFGRLVAAGVAAVIGLHAGVNMAMVTGLAPVVGVPLPLVSYGGTSLLTLMFGMGLALSAVVHRADRPRPREFGVIW